MSEPEREPVPVPEPEAQPDENPPDRLRRIIAITLAAIVVLGAGISILQNDAGVSESNTARETTRTAVRAMRANVALDAALGAQADLDEERGSALISRLRLDAAYYTLSQFAQATTRVTWNTRSTQYTTVLAVVAAALFLVGFGLVVERSLRIYSYGLGLAIAIFTAGWAAYLYQLPIPVTPDEAIEAAARGEALTGAGDYRAAVGAYDRAIAIDPGYAAAYTGRSRARLFAANPDLGVTGALTDPTGGQTDQAVVDARRALELGARRALLDQSIVALDAVYRSRYQAAAEATAAAIENNPSVPDVWLLRTAAQLANGDDSGASISYLRARALIEQGQATDRSRMLSANLLSYLARVGHDKPDRAEAARALADRVVADETAFTLGRHLSRTAPAGASVAIEDLRYANGRFAATLRWSGLPEGTALTAIGYERPRRDGPWAQPPELALFANTGGSGERRIALPVDRTCEPTAVRIEAYLDGAPVTSATGPGTAPTC